MSSFPPDLEAYVHQKLSTGQFGSEDEFTAEAVRVYRELENRHTALKSDIQAAIDEADRGLCEPLDVEAIKSELTAELDSRGRPI
jgi:Arc/MetJ-type ribon-helix-helix transcriptional regulator